MQLGPAIRETASASSAAPTQREAPTLRETTRLEEGGDKDPDLTRRKISLPLRTLDRFNRVVLLSAVRIRPAIRGCSASPLSKDAEDLALEVNISVATADVRLGSCTEVARGMRFNSGALVATGRFKSGAFVAAGKFKSRPIVSDGRFKARLEASVPESSLVSPSYRTS